ncbi:hypothetical protein QE152_g29278 [Popillia japonica]|uniref:Uncharacterized protein n=1 Tax=Popillia japonica TaxID=7064 RepID=A0AAW1JHN7_POPJA
MEDGRAATKKKRLTDVKPGGSWTKLMARLGNITKKTYEDHISRTIPQSKEDFVVAYYKIRDSMKVKFLRVEEEEEITMYYQLIAVSGFNESEIFALNWETVSKNLTYESQAKSTNEMEDGRAATKKKRLTDVKPGGSWTKLMARLGKITKKTYEDHISRTILQSKEDFVVAY